MKDRAPILGNRVGETWPEAVATVRQLTRPEVTFCVLSCTCYMTWRWGTESARDYGESDKSSY